jgi:hypothetical protein
VGTEEENYAGGSYAVVVQPRGGEDPGSNEEDTGTNEEEDTRNEEDEYAGVEEEEQDTEDEDDVIEDSVVYYTDNYIPVGPTQEQLNNIRFEAHQTGRYTGILVDGAGYRYRVHRYLIC